MYIFIRLINGLRSRFRYMVLAVLRLTKSGWERLSGLSLISRSGFRLDKVASVGKPDPQWEHSIGKLYPEISIFRFAGIEGVEKQRHEVFTGISCIKIEGQPPDDIGKLAVSRSLQEVEVVVVRFKFFTKGFSHGSESAIKLLRSRGFNLFDLNYTIRLPFNPIVDFVFVKEDGIVETGFFR